MRHTHVRPHLAFALLVACLLSSRPAWAQLADPAPQAIDEIQIVEHLEQTLPLDLSFKDEDGSEVRLGEYFRGERPTVLTLNYYGCPMLCTLQLNGLVEGLQELDWTVGKEFEIVTVSINPLETPTLARHKKQSYLQEYGRPEAFRGWHFLTGRQEEITRLADLVGFKYEYVEETGEYAHAAVIMIATPEGRLSRYLYGVTYDPTTLRYSLLEASAGKIGSPLDQILLYCFHYDASLGRYAPAAINLMRAAGALTAVIVGVVLLGWWRREARRRRAISAGVHG